MAQEELNFKKIVPIAIIVVIMTGNAKYGLPLILGDNK